MVADSHMNECQQRWEYFMPHHTKPRPNDEVGVIDSPGLTEGRTMYGSSLPSRCQDQPWEQANETTREKWARSFNFIANHCQR
jgi:hypothetical protein